MRVFFFSVFFLIYWSDRVIYWMEIVIAGTWIVTLCCHLLDISQRWLKNPTTSWGGREVLCWGLRVCCYEFKRKIIVCSCTSIPLSPFLMVQLLLSAIWKAVDAETCCVSPVWQISTRCKAPAGGMLLLVIWERHLISHKKQNVTSRYVAASARTRITHAL